MGYLLIPRHLCDPKTHIDPKAHIDTKAQIDPKAHIDPKVPTQSHKWWRPPRHPRDRTCRSNLVRKGQLVSIRPRTRYHVRHEGHACNCTMAGTKLRYASGCHNGQQIALPHAPVLAHTRAHMGLKARAWNLMIRRTHVFATP